MKLSNRLFRILDQYKIAMTQHFRAQQVALSPLHYKVLQLIHALDPATPQLIAQRSGRDKAQVTRLRGAKSAEALHALLAGGEARDAA